MENTIEIKEKDLLFALQEAGVVIRQQEDGDKVLRMDKPTLTRLAAKVLTGPCGCRTQDYGWLAVIFIDKEEQ